MISRHAAAVLARVDELAIQPVAGSRGWTHMGAVLADASLQAGITYKTTVLPRVKELLASWPDAATTSALIGRMRSEDIAQVLDWKADSKKMNTLRDLAEFLLEESIESTAQLGEALDDEGFRGRLRRVKGVGPKTIDYLSILTGSTEHVAVDSQLRAFVRDAGVPSSAYQDVRSAVTEAAAVRGWGAGALDAAIWEYQTGDRAKP